MISNNHIFKKRYLISAIGSVLLTTSPVLFAEDTVLTEQIVADATHGSQTGIQGGVYIANGVTLADSALLASGAEYTIQGSGMDIKLNPLITSSIGTLVYANNGATISLDNATITQGSVLATGAGTKLILNNSSILEDYSVVDGIQLRDGAYGELNNLSVKGNLNLSILVTDGSSANVDKLDADGGIVIMRGSSIALKNSTINAPSFIGTGISISELSTANIENTHILGNWSGMDVRDSTVNFTGGSIIGGNGGSSSAMGLSLANSQFSGSNVVLQGQNSWGIQATRDSALILTNNAKVIGTIQIDDSVLELTDVEIRATNPDLYHGEGIFVTNCQAGCDIIKLQRVDIDTVADKGHGVFLSMGGQSDISGSNIVTHGNQAAGINLAGNSINADASYINISNSHIETQGDGSQGILLRTYNDTKRVTSTLNNVSLITKGNGSAALSVTEGTTIIGNNVTADVQGASAVLNLDSGSLANRNVVTLDGGSLVSQNGIAITAGGYSDINLKNLTISGKNGLLQAYNSATLNSTFDNVNANGDTTVGAGSTVNMSLLNSSTLTGSVNNAALLVDNSVWNITGNSSVNGLQNNGAVNFINMTGTGRTLTVNGDYIATNASLTLNTVLGDDTAETDRMVVTGNTLGNTDLRVNNISGLGDNTVDGINIISIGGQSNGSFTLKGRVGYGGYEYLLYKGDLAGNGGDWYLRSVYTEPTPDPDPTPTPDPIPDPTPTPGPTPRPVPASRMLVEPEAGAYIGNQIIANTLFNLNLHDRMGEPQFTTRGDSLAESMWLRVVGSHEKNHAAGGRLEVKTNSSVVQLGGDIAQWDNGQSRTHLGLMAGYGNAHLTSDSRQINASAKSDVTGYNVGVYATWYANQDLQQNGLYVDSWLQHNWFDNDVNGDERSTISYKSKGFSASLETGYTLKISDFNQSSLFIQPQAQLIWSAVR